MKRKVSVYIPEADRASGNLSRLKQGITDTLGQFDLKLMSLPEEIAATAVSMAKSGEISIVAVSSVYFLKTKLNIIRASSQKAVRSKAIIEKMGDNAPLDAKIKDLHAAAPQGSKVFTTQDGLFSSIAFKVGDGLIILLPLDETKTEFLLNGELGKLLSALNIKETAAEPKPEKENSYESFKKHIASVVIKGKKIAVANCGSAKNLIPAISSVDPSNCVFMPDKEVIERNNKDTAENYIANCAKKAKENLDTDLGICISSLYNDPSANLPYVIVGVADSKRAKIAKVYGIENETSKSLIIASMIKLCEMLDDLTDSEKLVNPDAKKPTPINKNKNPRLIALIAGITIVAVLAICAIIVFFLGGNNKSEDAQTYAAGPASYQNILYGDGAEYDEDDDSFFYYIGGSASPESDYDVLIDNYSPDSSILQNSSSYSLSYSASEYVSLFTSSLTTLCPPITDIFTTFSTKPTTKRSQTTTANAKTTAKKGSNSNIKPGVASNTDDTGKLVIENGSLGTFVFTVYGWGHGVGMSQDGAIQMAKNSSNYKQILTHYYSGTSIVDDPDTPDEITYGGTAIPIVEYLCRTAKKEIGTSAPSEAIKAQMVAIYTYAKYYDFNVSKSLHAYDSKYEYQGTAMEQAAFEVLSMNTADDTPVAKYVDYNGKACFTCYFASAAGKTASSKSVWGIEKDYLSGGVASPEPVDVTTVQISAEQMREYIEKYAKSKNVSDLVLSDDPSDWLEILGHDSSYSSKIGYITKIRVGNKIFIGNDFRERITNYKLRSHCFTFKFVAA